MAKTKVILFYYRVSWAEDDPDEEIARQRFNKELAVRREGWYAPGYRIIEIVDAEGHKSGTQRANRDGYNEALDLITHGLEGDEELFVFAVDEQARAIRDEGLGAELAALLAAKDICLYEAGSGRSINMNDPTDRLQYGIKTVVDAYYARYASQLQRQKNREKRSLGKTHGPTPYATRRIQSGPDRLYLELSPAGVVTHPDGRREYVEEPPSEPDVRFHALADSVERILELMAEGLSNGQIASQLLEEEFTYVGSKQRPRAFKRQDVRRIRRVLYKYGGAILPDTRNGKGDDPFRDTHVDDIPWVAERAVFPLDLIKRAYKGWRRAASSSIHHGSTKGKYPSPLTGILWCAHCEAAAERHKDPARAYKLTGNRYHARYDHSRAIPADQPCGCQTRSTKWAVIHPQFLQLVALLSVPEPLLATMVEIAQSLKGVSMTEQRQNATKRQRELDKLRRNLHDVVYLLKEGLISRSEFDARRGTIEDEIAYWNAFREDAEEIEIEMTEIVALVNDIPRLWDMAAPQDRQDLVRALFGRLVYDLDAERFTHFEMHPEMAFFLMGRYQLDLLDDAQATDSTQNQNRPDQSGLPTSLCPQGASFPDYYYSFL